MGVAPVVSEHVRVYDQVRSVHLERAVQSGPVTILYGARRYDFDESLADRVDVIQCGLTRMALKLAGAKVRVLEINEPLLLSGVMRSAVAVAVVRMAALVRRSPCLVVTYAIGNFDHMKAPAPRRRTAVRRRLNYWLARRVASQVDQIAFGTTGADKLYQQLFSRQLLRAERSVIPALPSPCGCGDREGDRGKSVLYVGAFHPRKGIRELLEAWPRVIDHSPRAQLTLIGLGRLEREVSAFANRTPGVTLIVDPPREIIHREMLRARTLVLLSQRTEDWREQVGLPIVEGLAHGCNVVTTTETGLADWLVEHGHEVLDPEATSEEVGLAISRAVADGPSAQSILRALPDIDGRLAADSWLLRNFPGVVGEATST